MEFKRRRMIKSEIDRLLSDEGTRNLLSGIKVIHKSKKLTRLVTRNNRLPNGNNATPSTKGITPSSTSSKVKVNDNKEKTKKIIKKSLSLLGHGGKINGTISNGKLSTTSKATNKVQANGVRTSSPATVNGTPAPNKGTPGNGVVAQVSSSGPSRLQVSPNLPLLATLIRGHVAFITLSYQNHLCTLRTQDLRDLVRKFEEYESRKGVSVIVLNSSSDRIFCDGLDYKELVHSDLNKRKLAVQNRILYMKNLLTALGKSKKLLIASVNGGKVSGFGLTLLGLFDLVYANDKATFSIQKYSNLKQPPEGISVFNPVQLASPLMKAFIFTGRVCTSSELHQNGFLVTEVLWDGSKYHEQLAAKLQIVNSQQNTKSIYKSYSAPKSTKQLNHDITHEFNSLESIWLSDGWQKSVVQQLHRHVN